MSIDMNDRALNRLCLIGAAVTTAAAAIANLMGAVGPSLGILAGGLWNLLSLWCLVRLLNAWVGPQRSTRRALGWLLVKFPLLYALLFVAFRHQAISLVGFGIGFTLVLCVALAILGLSAQQMIRVRAHGPTPYASRRFSKETL